MSEWNENVDWYEAATAYKAGTHEVEVRREIYLAAGETPSLDWKPVVEGFPMGKQWKYRIRVKPRTITVTTQRPQELWKHRVTADGWGVTATYKTEDEATAAWEAINAALEQQP